MSSHDVGHASVYLLDTSTRGLLGSLVLLAAVLVPCSSLSSVLWISSGGSKSNLMVAEAVSRLSWVLGLPVVVRWLMGGSWPVFSTLVGPVGF